MPHREKDIYEKIKLTNGWTAYVLWRSAGPDPSPQKFECFEASREVVIVDIYPEPSTFVGLSQRARPRVGRT